MSDLPSGFVYIPDFITTDQEMQITDAVCAELWGVLGQRRVQQYGYEYSYRDRSVHRTKPVPQKLRELLEPIYTHFDCEFDQMLINRYLIGQGIAAHIDADVFDDRIVVLSLGSSCVLQLEQLMTGITHEQFIENRSLYIMQDEVRQVWKHSIPARKKDVVGDQVYPRNVRTSITLRSLR